MMDVYEKFDQEFNNIQAYAITLDKKHVGNIVFKMSKTKTQVTCYLHFLGSRKQRVCVKGGRCDLFTSVFYKNLEVIEHSTHVLRLHEYILSERKEITGMTWDTILKNAGYEILKVI